MFLMAVMPLDRKGQESQKILFLIDEKPNNDNKNHELNDLHEKIKDLHNEIDEKSRYLLI